MQFDVVTVFAGTSHSRAYLTGFVTEWFLAELWPMNKKMHFFSLLCVLSSKKAIS